MTPSPFSQPDPEDRLLRLLALKRYEVPPPGFFDRLPGRVLATIRNQDRHHSTTDSWWKRLWSTLVLEPMVAASYAALGIGTFVFGSSVLLTAIESADDHGPTPETILNGAFIADATIGAPHADVLETDSPLRWMPRLGNDLWLQPAGLQTTAGSQREWNWAEPGRGGIPTLIGFTR